jgi:hypothetical protein
MNGLRCDSRIRGVHYLTALAWRAAGGTDEAPKALVLSFALNFSAFSTQALVIDFDQTPAQVGRLTADILKVALRRAVEAQGAAGGEGATDADSDES